MRFVVLATALLLFGTDTLAEQRFYIGAHLGASQFDGRADADGNGLFTGILPSEISINGLSFDSTETAWGVFFGWNAKSWLALEIGYSDLGNAGETLLTAVPLPAPVPLTPVPTGTPGGFGTPGVIARPTGFTRGVALGIEEWYIGTKFSVPLSSTFRANWSTGISRASFETQGGIPIFESPVVPFNFFLPNSIPFASPSDETGLVWGFGFGWEATDQLSLDLGFHRHDTRVLDVDTLSLGLMFSF